MTGKVALVTGAASGIGKAIAQRLAAEGARVALADLNDAGAASVADAIGATGGEAIALRLDVTSEADWETAMARILEMWGGLDICVNCAGIAFAKPIVDLDLADWRRVLTIHLDGVFLGTKHALYQRLQRRYRNKSSWGTYFHRMTCFDTPAGSVNQLGNIINAIRNREKVSKAALTIVIHGELLKLGIAVAQRSIAKYRVPRARRPPSQNWKAFLRNHLSSVVSVDFLTVPTLTFRVLYVFIVLSHHRRRLLHFNVVESPSAGWTAQQLRKAFPFTSPLKYLLRDRDSIYGLEFQRRAKALGLEEVRIAPRSPWQSPYVERLIGSVRRECLDHVIVINQTHLHGLLKAYFAYYHRSRTHLGLDKDAPEPRPVQGPESRSRGR